jgi:hypothetical protein
LFCDQEYDSIRALNNNDQVTFSFGNTEQALKAPPQPVPAPKLNFFMNKKVSLEPSKFQMMNIKFVYG